MKMDSPVTLKHALVIVLVGAVLAALPVGYGWTTLVARADAAEYKLNSIETAMERISECRVTQSEAEANRTKIANLESSIEAWEGIADACRAALAPEPEPEPGADKR